jgi:hypothetical protein
MSVNSSIEYFKHKLFWYAVMFAIAVIILYFRGPQDFTAPQFWAEDGRVWYEEAHNNGFWSTLFKTQDGYLQTFPRVIAEVSQWVPLDFGPYVFTYTSLLLQVVIALFIFSERLASLLPARWARALLALLFLLLPNTAEVSGNLTNAQWYLALLVVLILIAKTPRMLWQRVFDGLTGPFIILVLPLEVARFLKERGRYQAFMLGCVGALALVQIVAVALHGSDRVWLFGFDVATITNIINKQIFSGFMFGSQGYVWIARSFLWDTAIFSVTMLIGLVLVARAVWYGSFELRMLVCISALSLAVSFVSPTVDSIGISPLTLLFESSSGARYWLISLFAFAAVLVYGIQVGNPRWLRVLSGAVLVTSIIGIGFDFKYPILPDLGFTNYAEQYYQLGTEQEINIPIHPLGPEDWTMTLRKK